MQRPAYHERNPIVRPIELTEGALPRRRDIRTQKINRSNIDNDPNRVRASAHVGDHGRYIGDMSFDRGAGIEDAALDADEDMGVAEDYRWSKRSSPGGHCKSAA